MSNEVSLRTDDGEMMRIPLAQIKNVREKTEAERQADQEKRAEYKEHKERKKKSA
jgi:hypothetical protein